MEEGPSKGGGVRGMSVEAMGWREGGVDLALLLEGVRSALEEQTWLMRQM